MQYYVMECEGIQPANAIGDEPDLPGGPWMTGDAVATPVDLPLEYTLDPEYPGNMCALYDVAFPLIRNDLANAIASAGVDNIDFYDAVIVDPTSGQRHEDYRAFNIIGAVAAADMEASEFMDEDVDEDAMIDVDFESLVLDPSKVPSGVLLFRLAQCVSAIIVHANVRKAIEAANIPGMAFYGDGEWAG